MDFSKPLVDMPLLEMFFFSEKCLVTLIFQPTTFRNLISLWEVFICFASGVQELLSSEAEDIYGNRPVILSLKPMTLIMLSVTRGPGSE